MRQHYQQRVGVLRLSNVSSNKGFPANPHQRCAPHTLLIFSGGFGWSSCLVGVVIKVSHLYQLRRRFQLRRLTRYYCFLLGFIRINETAKACRLPVKNNGVFTPEQDNDKTRRQRQDKKITTRQRQKMVEPVHSCDALHQSGNKRNTWFDNGKTRRQNEVEPCCWSDLFTECEYPTSKISLSCRCLVVLSLSCSGVKTPLV